MVVLKDKNIWWWVLNVVNCGCYFLWFMVMGDCEEIGFLSGCIFVWVCKFIESEIIVLLKGRICGLLEL